jgi:hypothetical protein
MSYIKIVPLPREHSYIYIDQMAIVERKNLKKVLKDISNMCLIVDNIYNCKQ